MSEPTVPLPDFTPEGRSARVVVSESARRNARRTLDIVASRLDGHRGGRWVDVGTINGARHWSIGDADDALEVEIHSSSQMLLGSLSPSAIVVRMLDFIAIDVACRPREAAGLVMSGPSAAIGWAVSACRLALAHGRTGQAPAWKPKPALLASLRALHDEAHRYRGGHVVAVHPSAVSDAGAAVCIHDEGFYETFDVQAGDASFVPSRPCRLVARSRLGAAGRNVGAPPGVKLVAPTIHVALDALDPMQVLRLLAAAGDGTTPLKGRRRR